MRQKGVKAIDLFCGVGGLTHGLIKAGIPVVAGIDNDSTCKYAYEKNNTSQFVEKDIEEVRGEEIIPLYGEADIKILVGCAPCQPFSTYTNGKSKGQKWKLLYEFSRIVNEIKPDIISMENVPQLIKHSVFSDFVKNLSEQGYTVSWHIVFCPDYGIPQRRRRLVLFGSKFGKISLIDKTHNKENYMTAREAIGWLEPIRDGEGSSKDHLHKARMLTEMNRKRIRETPPGGSWKDWDKSLILPCHKKPQGRSFKGVYGRIAWDDLGPTITTQFYSYGSGRFGHPSQHRALSYREGALIQTFPKNYEFIDPKVKFSGTAIGRHIGNAVPVELGKVIAKSIKKHLRIENSDR